MTTETVLIIGATGHIGVSAAIATLRSGRNVLAFVRNAQSAEKLYANAATREGITTVEADVTSYASMRQVVKRVEAGELPAFQHVYCAGGASLFMQYVDDGGDGCWMQADLE